MALRFPAKKKPKPQKDAVAPDSHVPKKDGGQEGLQQDVAHQEAFHLEMDLHPEELSLLRKLSEQFVRMLGGISSRALRKPRPRAPLTRSRKPKSLPRARSGAAGRKVASVRRKVAHRR